MTLPLEIRDPIHGPIQVSPKELDIIDSPYVQRLRGIRQLGFAEMAFPGATHNRYSHSLGAFHLAGKAFDQIFQEFDWASREERLHFRSVLRMAALLHDVGHGPLSHAIEQAMPLKSEVVGSGEGQARHEDYTFVILMRSSLNQKLKETFSEELPEMVAALIDKDESKTKLFRAGDSKPLNLFPLLSSLISGEMDVDRMDYLVRDSLYCGTPYGNFDREWIFSNLSYIEKDESVFLALDSRAIYSFEDFLLSRYHMYIMVYLHHKSVIYDEMLYQFLNTSRQKISLPSSVEDYLEIDDYWLKSQLRSSDNAWSKRIIDQKPYRMLLELHDDQKPKAEDFANALEQDLKKQNIPYFRSSSTGILSRYAQNLEKVKDPFYILFRDPRYHPSTSDTPVVEPASQVSQLYSRYHSKKIIDRIYADRKPTKT